MRRLHVKLYLMTVVVLVLFTVIVAMIWHSASIGSRMVLHGAHAVMMLGTVAAALALLAYPLVRGLTARLGRLNEGVRKFGAGDLAARVTVEGNDEVAALATSFNDSAARIEQLVRANQMLLANCSHELRTPLTRMRLAIEKLGSDDGKQMRSWRATSPSSTRSSASCCFPAASMRRSVPIGSSRSTCWHSRPRRPLTTTAK